MNWKLIFQLSFFGLIMAFATIALIPEKIEPAFWLIIFVFCAYVIAKTTPGKCFLQGFMVGIVNCVWITAVHIWFYNSYAAHHTATVAMYGSANPHSMMLVFGPVFGILFGIILGLICLGASKIVEKNTIEN